MKGLGSCQENEWWIMQAASRNLTSAMCRVIIAQTIASPDPGNVVLHFFRHLYKRVTANLTSRKLWENMPIFPETAWTGCPSPTDPSGGGLVPHICFWQKASASAQAVNVGLVSSHQDGHLSGLTLCNSGNWKWEVASPVWYWESQNSSGHLPVIHVSSTIFH